MRATLLHFIYSNHVFSWRLLYIAERLGECKPAMKLLPVHVSIFCQRSAGAWIQLT